MQNRLPIVQRLSQKIREGSVVDIYQLVEDLKSQFPQVAESELTRIVNEEVLISHANALWEKRES